MSQSHYYADLTRIYLVFVSHEENSKVQMRAIRNFLGILSLPDEHHEKLQGSCDWIDEREDYREWRDACNELEARQGESHYPSIYWVTARPGAGKSILAEHIVSQLDEFHLQLAFYYFHAGKKESQSLAGCLRSIAFQMTASNAALRDTVAKLCNDGSTFDHDDARAIWSKVFRAVILQVC